MSPVRITAVLLLLALSLLPLSAFASCSLSGSKETVNMTLPATITIDPTSPVGTVLATSSPGNPSPNTSQVTCNNTTNVGVINLAGGQPVGSSTIFPTGVAGVGYQILHPDTNYILPPWGYDSIGSGTYTLSVGSAVQLVKTGPITAGSTLTSGTLGYWQYQGSRNTLRTEDFVLSNNVKFVAPTCTVATPNIAVTLPTVSTRSLTSTGAVSGATAFTIGLTCSAAASGQTMAIEIDASRAVPPGTTGVLTSTGSAGNVGVQLIDSSFKAVSLGTPVTVGTTPTGAYNLTYYAQYYALANSTTAGTVSATATFTISYP